ncbi:GvpL/GvpF family gas vesicle protein [Kitasatospora purpeofusca]|uniref:GvpL/GvpF family gas vesicle protein n=1 Tax=Kitasatospora purpeofusca TaxID=67352 RepID=UPI002A5AD1D9|nr:GvpL/GvpF family gas vesicle protein [Kitasatospora purpeofusca]MDY0812775.1 GvpL/GvpF family gas vesicle protein [Kitasatospora purpeofusca]
MTARSLAYTYAVAQDAPDLRRAVDSLTGVVGAPVHLVRPSRGGEAVATVSPVPGEDFDQAALAAHLEDLQWLEALARSHHGVIEAIAGCTTVLPLRLATVYLDDDRVRSVLDDGQRAFLEQLTRLAEHVEWGVKLYIEAPAGAQAAPSRAPDRAPDLSPGRAYLHRRRAEQESQHDAFRAAEEAAERIGAAAREHAAGRARHRVQQGELAVEPGVNVMNDAYLVPLDHAEAFRADVLNSTDSLTGVRVVVTGPWAPYSFADRGPAGESAP